MKKTALLLLFINSLCILANDKLETKHDLTIGSENFQSSININGGNYAYFEYLHAVSPYFSFGGKISTDIVPLSFDDVLITGNIQLMTPIYENNMQPTLGLFFMGNQSAPTNENDFLGCRISLINNIPSKRNARI